MLAYDKGERGRDSERERENGIIWFFNIPKDSYLSQISQKLQSIKAFCLSPQSCIQTHTLSLSNTECITLVVTHSIPKRRIVDFSLFFLMEQKLPPLSHVVQMPHFHCNIIFALACCIWTFPPTHRPLWAGMKLISYNYVSATLVDGKHCINPGYAAHGCAAPEQTILPQNC